MSDDTDPIDAQLALYRGDPNYSGPQVVYDFEEEEPEVQRLLPGMRKAIGWPKRDWRKWKNEKKEKVDAPKYRGRMSTWGGKLIPLPTDRAGHPLKMNEFQVMLCADGSYIVADWSKPLGENCVYIAKGLRDACQVLFMFVKWKHWQGPLKKGQSRHKAIFGVEQRARPPAPPPPPRELEADPVLSASEDEDTVSPLVRKLMWD